MKMQISTATALFVLAVISTPTACGGPSNESLAEPVFSNTGEASQHPVQASFEGTMLDLASDWGEAHSCVIWRQGGIIQCFRTTHEHDRLVAKIEDSFAKVSNLAPTPDRILACSRSCLHLYQDSNFRSRELTFCDRGYWQNLTGYGFNDELSSYKTGAHGVHLAEHTNGGGYWYPGNTGACVAAGGMSSGWNDRVSSIYIQ